MTITMPVGGPCAMHEHEGPGACPKCQAEIARFNEEMRKAQPCPLLPAAPPIVWPPPLPGATGLWTPPIHDVGTPPPGQAAEIWCRRDR